MRESLADSLAIPARDLPAILVSRAERARLQKLAARLAPVHCGGFEIRLNGARGRVDLQQRITRRNAEPERFAAYLAASGLCERPAWRRIRDFLRAWNEEDLARQVIECWLEYEPAADPVAPPSVFVCFTRRGGSRSRLPAVRRALGLLAGREEAIRLTAAAAAIARRLPVGAAIFDIGLMARRPSVLRLNIGGFPRTGLAAVLAALGWDREERSRIGVFARAAAPFARDFKLALDWRGGLLPRAGLEVAPGGGPELADTAETRARWRGLLAWLGENHACDGGRAAALLAWPGVEEPPGCPRPWPESLMLESLSRGARSFSLIGRRLSHVKVDFVPGQPPAAKAYFGFLPVWHAAPIRRPAPAKAPRPHRSIARGAAFLIARRGPDGFWRDFHAVDGGSDQWLSAYVAAELAGAGLRTARDAARKTWELLAGLETGPGWRYSAGIPADADSTSWALRLAAMVGRLRDPAAQNALTFVRRHRARDGGVATFLPEHLGASRTPRVPRALAGWCQAHAEVTAAAGALPGFATTSAAWLLNAQHADGHWQSYWYDEDAFATALAAEHLAGRPGAAFRRARERAGDWAAARVAADGSVAAAGIRGGSAFAAACCLRILLASPRSDPNRRAAHRIVAWLGAAQLGSGAWDSSAPLRKTLTSDRQPRAFGARLAFSWDGERLFTTATVLAALGRFVASNVRG